MDNVDCKSKSYTPTVSRYRNTSTGRIINDFHCSNNNNIVGTMTTIYDSIRKSVEVVGKLAILDQSERVCVFVYKAGPKFGNLSSLKILQIPKNSRNSPKFRPWCVTSKLQSRYRKKTIIPN